LQILHTARRINRSDDKGGGDLFSEDDCRSASFDEFKGDGPEVALVGLAFLFARRGKGLAGAGQRPDGLVFRPSCELESSCPAGDPGKEMHLGETFEVARAHLDDGSLVNDAGRDESPRDKFSEPSCRVFVIFVVVVHKIVGAGVPQNSASSKVPLTPSPSTRNARGTTGVRPG
jgi:hypothetical protein